MLAPLAKWIDWSALQFWWALRLRSVRRCHINPAESKLAEAVEDLWQAWGQPEIWRLPHGHVSWMFAPRVTGRVLRWLKPRLNQD